MHTIYELGFVEGIVSRHQDRNYILNCTLSNFPLLLEVGRKYVVYFLTCNHPFRCTLWTGWRFPRCYKGNFRLMTCSALQRLETKTRHSGVRNTGVTKDEIASVSICVGVKLSYTLKENEDWRCSRA
jgi:hypothetical protein